MRWNWDSHISCDTERKYLENDQEGCSVRPRPGLIGKIALVLLLVVAFGFDCVLLDELIKTLLDLE